MTIAEAAAEILRSNNEPMDLESILARIKARKLYQFNSIDDLAILREQVRRHCELPDKTLQYEPLLFSIDSDGLFSLVGDSKNGKKKTTSMRRIRRAIDKEDVIERLAKKTDSPFADIWRLLLFAASIGVQAGKREPIGQHDSGKSIDFTYFSGCPAWPGLVHLIGLVASKDPKILNPDQDQMDYRVMLFEEYANAGLRILRETGEAREYSLDSIVNLIPSAESTPLGSLNVAEI